MGHETSTRTAPSRPPPPARTEKWGPLIKAYWLDYIVLVVIGAISIGIYVAPPAGTRLFSVYKTNEATPRNDNIAYPIKPEIIPMWLSGLTAFIFAFIAFVGVLIRQRSPADFMAATMGLLYSICGSSFFQVVCKWLIGGLRPHFLAVCDPDPTRVAAGQGIGGIYYDRSICRGDAKEVNDALQSFPSGHSNVAWAGLVFLFFYLNGKLKLHSRRQTPFWKLLVVTLPILAASLLSLSRLLDFTHNWYDILVGSIIGATYATLTYRMHYHSLLDYRTNHIPLPKLQSDVASYDDNGTTGPTLPVHEGDLK